MCRRDTVLGVLARGPDPYNKVKLHNQAWFAVRIGITSKSCSREYRETLCRGLSAGYQVCGTVGHVRTYYVANDSKHVAWCEAQMSFFGRILWSRWRNPETEVHIRFERGGAAPCIHTVFLCR